MTTKKPTIVFCHGIWADGSCFSKVIPALQADGHEVISVQYSLESYQEDLATVKRTLNRVGSPVLLVGHSYGGATITGAGVDDRVAGLVYIAAVAPDAGETVNDQLNKYPSDIFNHVEVTDNLVWMADQAELVRACHRGPHRPPRPAALGLDPHGRQGHRSRQQPRADAFPARRRHRRDPRGRSGGPERLSHFQCLPFT